MAGELTIRPYEESDEHGWVVCRLLSFLDAALYDNVRQFKEHYEHPASELVAEQDGEIVGSSTSNARSSREPSAKIGRDWAG